MVDTAISKYNCPNCQIELEQEGFIAIDVQEPQANALYNMTLNKVTCPNCSFEHYLGIPLFYHDSSHQLLICFMPGVREMSPTDLADNMRVPYERLMMNMAERLGIELPEPDAAAFPIGQEHLYTPFSALTAEQSEALFPHYLLRPMVVDNLEVMSAVAQAVRDGMQAQEVLDDMTRLQLINGVINAPDPIARRKVLHHHEPYLNNELYEVIDTLVEQMQQEGNTDMIESLEFAKTEVQRYKEAQQKRLKEKKS